MKKLKITSKAFDHDGMIPQKYTSDGANVNPPLHIENIPEDTESLAIIVDDPDAPMQTWVHWVVWNIPVVNQIEENSLPEGSVVGTNNFHKQSWGGPCPPSGHGPHEYHFKVYALDQNLTIREDSKKSKLLEGMDEHILSKGKLVGKYKRK